VLSWPFGNTEHGTTRALLGKGAAKTWQMYADTTPSQIPIMLARGEDGLAKRGLSHGRL